MIERAGELEVARHPAPQIADVVAEKRRQQIHRQTVGRNVQGDLSIGGEARASDTSEGKIDRYRPLSDQKGLPAGSHRLGAPTQSLIRVLNSAVHLGHLSAIVEQISRAERAAELRVAERTGAMNVERDETARVDVALRQRDHV